MRPAGVATALYGWMERAARDGVDWDWHSLYGACAAAGVDAVETDPTPPKLAILERLGLRVSASYVGIPLHIGDVDIDGRVLPVAERLAAAGGRDLILNADQDDWSVPLRKTADDARRQGEQLSRIAARVAPLGLRVSLHNHADDAGNAARDLESVVVHADPAVGLCIDTGWALVAGHDPVAWAREHGDRVFAMHLRSQRGRTSTEDLLDGELDVAALIAALPQYDGWLTLELWHPEPLEPTGTMGDAVRRSAAHLRGLIDRPQRVE